ncbi:MAG TPA: hypothetical protein DCS54_03890 [Oribacterium sp.]|nr:hypothetical protein [Oribacterium sp.]
MKGDVDKTVEMSVCAQKDIHLYTQEKPRKLNSLQKNYKNMNHIFVSYPQVINKIVDNLRKPEELRE